MEARTPKTITISVLPLQSYKHTLCLGWIYSTFSEIFKVNNIFYIPILGLGLGIVL